MKRFATLYFSFFAFHFSFAQSWMWGNSCNGDAGVTSVISDAYGNCYATGVFENDTIKFGNFTLMNSTVTNSPYSSDNDVFLVKYSHNGSIAWAKQTMEKNINPYIGNNAPESICTDGSGNIYLSSNFVDTIFIGSNMLVTEEATTLSQNTFMAKYDSNGNVLWAKKAMCISDSSTINEEGISNYKNEGIYVTGVFADTVRIGSYILGASYQGLLYPYLAKYDTNGNVKWVSQSTGHSLYGAVSYAVANDKNGNAFITGGFEDTMVFGTYKLSSLASIHHNCFIAKYDSLGNALWAKNPHIPSEYSGGEGFALTTDQSGNVYLAGNFIDTLVFDSYTLIGPKVFQYQSSFFLVKYDPNGNILWAERANVLDNNNWSAWGLSSDNYNHIYLSATGGFGMFKVAFGGDTLSMVDTAKNDGASIIFKLDSNGNTICSSIIPAGAYGGNSNTVASDTSGKYVYFGGTVISTVIFGNDTVNPFAFSVNAIQRLNYFPFVARWEACDSAAITAGISSSKTIGQVNLYPNPNTGTFTIALQNVNESAQVEVYNVLGEEIYQSKLNFSNTTVNLGGQPNGIYLYRAVKQTGELIGSGKLIIER
jgi:hypothetical protein